MKTEGTFWHFAKACIAALLIALAAPAARADADLDAALRAFGAKQHAARDVGRETAPATGLMPTSGDHPEARHEATLVKDALQRTTEVTTAALADHNRGGFDARFDASIASVKALLGEPLQGGLNTPPMDDLDACREEHP
jgi:hypothetical protein